MMEKLIEVNGLKKYFPVRGGFFNKIVAHLKAVDDVSFYINKGEVLGVVGESGCGKSTTGRAILRLHEPDTGEVIFEGTNICKLDNENLRRKRRDMQLIYQDPYSSLNPRKTVGDIVGEPLFIHEKLNREQRKERVKELLQLVGLSPFHIRRYPHEFSGGQRQRIGIARSLACNPKFIVCDEAVSALDVSIQAQIINLFEELKNKLGLTYMFISHDLSVVKHISDRITVMYLGKMVEMADTDELFNNPMHPYTKALLSAVPIPDPRRKINRIMLYGDVPSAINTPPGCVFAARCSYCIDICRQKTPEFKDRGNAHFAACHILDK